MKAVIPLRPPGYKRDDIPGTVKEMCDYVQNLQEQIDFLLGQLQKSVKKQEEQYDAIVKTIGTKEN